MTQSQEKITVESTSINDALVEGSKQFGVELSQLSYTVDRSHFRTEEGKSVGRETIKIFIHGFLHLLGYDHVKGKDYKKMFIKEQKIFNSLKKILN